MRGAFLFPLAYGSVICGEYRGEKCDFENSDACLSVIGQTRPDEESTIRILPYYIIW